MDEKEPEEVNFGASDSSKKGGSGRVPQRSERVVFT